MEILNVKPADKYIVRWNMIGRHISKWNIKMSKFKNLFLK